MRPEDIEVLTDVEHVLTRSGVYVGSIQVENSKKWILINDKFKEVELKFIPALIRIIEEVITNSIDEGIKTNFKFSNKIKINIEYKNDKLKVSIEDNGRGLTEQIDNVTGEYKSIVAFTQLRTGSNFGENTSIGTNGMGVSLTNIFSNDFRVESINTNGYKTVLECVKNNSEIRKKVVKKTQSKSYGTIVEFEPDLNRFVGIDTQVIENCLKIIEKRIYDLSMLFHEITFWFNDNKIKTSKFKEYLKLFDKEYVSYQDDNIKIAVFNSSQFKFLSFINGVETIRGGTHLDLAVNKIQTEIKNRCYKRYKYDIKPSDIRENLFFILITKFDGMLKWDSQTKERVTNIAGDFNGMFDIPESFYKEIMGCTEIIDPIIETHKIKEQVKENLDMKRLSKKISKSNVSKLVEANSRDVNERALFIVEGDSALGPLIRVRDTEKHAGFPLRGKIMNVFKSKDKDVLENKELSELLSVIGLTLGKKAENIRYNSIIILTDADVDGNSITSLLLAFFYKYWPELYEEGKIRKYVSPIIIARKLKEVKRFYNLNEFEREKYLDWKIEYNKGLGGLDDKEYERMIHRPIEYTFTIDDMTKNMMNIVFGDDSSLRKKWLMKEKENV